MGLSNFGSLEWQQKLSMYVIRNVICTCSLDLSICFCTFRMNFELRGWPPQPLTFISNSTKITKNCTNLNFSFDMLEAVQASL